MKSHACVTNLEERSAETIKGVVTEMWDMF